MMEPIDFGDRGDPPGAWTGRGLPRPTLATVFEVVAAGKIYHVTGTALQRWIVEKARLVERPEGIPILPTPRLGILESRARAREHP